MAARKRGRFETFKAYREHLKKEENSLNGKLSGRVLWPAYMGTALRVTYDHGGMRGLVGKGEVGGNRFVAYS